MKILRATPILIVDAIEPNLDFWEKRLGYSRTVEVPHGERLGFVILVRDGLEVMLQTRASISDDAPALMQYIGPNTVIQYIDVDSLEEVQEQLKGIPLLMQPRETFYGTREIMLRDPSGFLLVYSQKL